MNKIRELAISEVYNSKKFQKSKELAEKGIQQNSENEYSSSTDCFREHVIHAMDALEQKSEASALIEQGLSRRQETTGLIS